MGPTLINSTTANSGFAEAGRPFSMRAGLGAPHAHVVVRATTRAQDSKWPASGRASPTGWREERTVDSWPPIEHWAPNTCPCGFRTRSCGTGSMPGAQRVDQQGSDPVRASELAHGHPQDPPAAPQARALRPLDAQEVPRRRAQESRATGSPRWPIAVSRPPPDGHDAIAVRGPPQKRARGRRARKRLVPGGACLAGLHPAPRRPFLPEVRRRGRPARSPIRPRARRLRQRAREPLDPLRVPVT